MRNPKTNIILITGLILGILLGLALKTTESYIAKELKILLEEETAAACPCTFEADELNISLLTLSASASGARIRHQDQTALEFKKLTLTFDIKDILQKKIYLSRLDLIDGFSDGFLGKSPTYKFIKQLTKPASPEKQKDPNRWRVRLEELRIRNLTAVDTIADQAIKLAGAELDMVRDANDDFVLIPKVKSLKFNETLNTGQVRSSLKILDDHLEFPKIKLKRGSSELNMNGNLDKASDYFQFGADYQINSEDYELKDWRGKLSGNAEIKGTIDDALITGDLNLIPESEFTLNIPEIPGLTFNKLATRYSFTHIEPDSEFKIEELNLSNNNIRISLGEDLKFNKDGLVGTVNLNIGSLDFEQYKLEDITAKIKLSGESANPKIEATGQLANLLINDFEFPNTNWKAVKDDRQLMLDFKHHNPSNEGTMQISGEVLLPEADQALSIEKLNYDFNNYTFQNKKFDRLQDFYLSGKGEIAGAAELTQLNGNGTLSLSTKFFAGESALNGKIHLNEGLIDLSLANQTNSLSARLSYDLLQRSDSNLQLKLTDFQTSDYHPELDCFKTTLESDYQFNPANFRAGSGAITISKLDIGCNQYALKLSKANRISVTEGQLGGVKLELAGNNSQLEVLGTASFDSTLNLQVNGDLELKALTILTPWLSDLRGNLAANVSLRGDATNPQFTGEAELTDTEFSFANEDLTGNGFHGKMHLVNNVIQIEKIDGSLNSSPVEIVGQINPINLAASDLSLKYSNFKYEPSSEFYLDTSGELNMTLDEARTPVLQGSIRVNEAIFNKEIGIGTALNYLREYLFAKRKSNAVTRSLSNLLLNVEINASRNLFIISSLLESELKGNLKIGGTLDQPLLTGKVESLYGWLGLRNSRFDLIEGVVLLTPNSPEPLINVLADTNVVNRIGEPIYISMEAHGAISSPIVTFDSDSNLNQQEILTLLTTRGLYRTRSQSSTSIRERIDDYQERKDQGFLDDIITSLTDLDSISIEPAFNNRSGLIEPSLTRTKKLSNKLSLNSETFIGGSTNDTRFVASYDLTPLIRLTGLADNATSQKNTALEFNTSFTLLSRNRKYLDTEFKGEPALSEESILDHLRLNSSSHLSKEDLPDIADRLMKYYQAQGYYQAEAEVRCLQEVIYCQKLEITANAGKQFKIINIEVKGDSLPDEIFNKAKKIIDQSATQKLKKDFTENLITDLRSEGYLQARLDTQYSFDPEHPQATMIINLELGRPLSFIFTGNKLFSDEELLKKTNLLKSRRTFGNNSTNILIKDIEKLYREAGYLFAVINSNQYQDNNDRTIIEISIIEEEPLHRIDVDFQNISPDLLDKLKKNIRKYDEEFADNLFLPKTIMDEELENNIFVLKRLLADEGYTDSQVTYELISPEDLEYQIIYKFDVSEKERAYQVTVAGYPEELELRNRPEETLSLERINSLEESIRSSMNRNAYLEALVSKTFIEELSEYQISIVPGNPVLIDQIDCQVDREISCEDIIRIMNLQKNQTASNRSLNSIKANLLKSGLFEEVTLELIKKDGEPLKQDLKIRTIEKQLTSLDLGLGVNSELGFHIFSEAVDRSLFKDGRSLGLRLDQYIDQESGEVNQGVAGLRYQDPYFLNEDLKFSSDLGYQKFNNPTLEFDLDRIILDESIQKSWSNLSSTFGYSFLNEQLDNVTPGAIISELDEGQLNLSYLYGNLNIDLRNDSSRPDLGLYFGLDYKLASKAIESDAGFYSLIGRASWTLPVFDTPFTLANNFALGSAWTYDDTPAIPISQRFYLGGRNSIRGFRENSLGPKGADGAIIGGDLSLSNNLELRYNLNQYLQLHSFYDLGNVFLDQRSISYSDLRESAGLGFRFKSPIGPIGLDFGHPLDRQEGEASWRVHFSVGSAF